MKGNYKLKPPISGTVPERLKSELGTARNKFVQVTNGVSFSSAQRSVNHTNDMICYWIGLINIPLGPPVLTMGNSSHVGHIIILVVSPNILCKGPFDQPPYVVVFNHQRPESHPGQSESKVEMLFGPDVLSFTQSMCCSQYSLQPLSNKSCFGHNSARPYFALFFASKSP